MIELFNKIVNAGTSYAKDPKDLKNIRLMNRLSVIVSFIMFLFAIITKAMQLDNMVYFAVPFMIVFAIAPIFNYTGWIAFARYYFTFVPILCVIAVCFNNGIQLGDRFFLLVSAPVPIILFRKKPLIISLFYLNVVAFFFVSWYQNNYSPYTIAPHAIESQYFNLTLFGVFSVLYFIIQYFRKGSEDYEKEIETKNEEISTKNKEITDSINYAKKIQSTLLAHNDFLEKHLPDHFVFFKPKDIVSGDFYWATEHNNKFYLAVCDSTGHGVPGAFMCLLNIGFLNEAIKEKNISSPARVFDHVRKRLIEDISKEGQQDGMDGILLKLETGKFEYAGANNAPVLIRNNEVIILSTDKMPVGKGVRSESFKHYTIDIQPGDTLYLYTDGFADQFGGPKGKKFKYKALNELLLANHKKTTVEQKEVFNSAFENWRGRLEQVDDVCLIGIKF